MEKIEKLSKNSSKREPPFRIYNSCSACRSLFFRKYDAFFSLLKKCAENYPEKEILKLHSIQSQLTLTALQCPRAGKFKIQSLGQNTAHFLGNGNNTNIFLRISDLYTVDVTYEKEYIYYQYKYLHFIHYSGTP